MPAGTKMKTKPKNIARLVIYVAPIRFIEEAGHTARLVRYTVLPCKYSKSTERATAIYHECIQGAVC
jgi:hypothetical protein